jgi:hypothetical protein
VARFESDVDRRLDEVAESVSRRLAAERAADNAAFERIRETPSRQAVVEALRRAMELGLIEYSRPPRVDVSSRDAVYLSVCYAPEDETGIGADEELTFALESAQGVAHDRIQWPESESIDDVFVKIGRGLQRVTGEDIDVATFFATLADVLLIAKSNPDLRPIVEICPPQWAITRTGVYRYDSRFAYGFSHEKLAQDFGLTRHIAEKPWGDPDAFDAAVDIARQLFRREEEPPF